MKVGFYQFDVAYKDKAANLDRIEAALADAGERAVELLVLPELFTTGILFESRDEVADLAEEVPGGETVRRLEAIAAKSGCTLIGSILEREGDALYDTAVVVGPQGYVGKQRKVHLTDYERTMFGRGDELRVFEVNGVPVGVLICFECWLPEVARTLYKKGAQVLVHPANIESPLTYEVARVRAMENVLPLVSCNRIGLESNEMLTYRFRGESRVIDHEGNLLALAGAEEVLQVVEIEPMRRGMAECKDLLGEIGIYETMK